MSWLSNIVGGGIGETAAAIGSAAKDIQDVFSVSDREQLAQYEAETRRIEAERADRQGQIDINVAEAQHPSMFVAGWRPLVGWTCGAAMLYHFILFPLFGKAIEQFGYPLVDLNWEELSVVLLGMLGMGGIRTFEKVKGVSRDRVKPKKA